MKEQLHDWEADIRQKVEQHEFGFEPQAWAEMEQLLEQASPGGSSSGSKGLKGLWWNIGLSVLLVSVIALITLWLYPEETAKPEPELSSFSISLPAPVEEEEEAESTKMPVLHLLPLRVKPLLPLKPSIRSIEEVTPLPPARNKKIEQLEWLPPPAIRPIPGPSSFENPDWRPPAPKRKRDRRKLFPDVIERNKK